MEDEKIKLVKGDSIHGREIIDYLTNVYEIKKHTLPFGHRVLIVVMAFAASMIFLHSFQCIAA